MQPGRELRPPSRQYLFGSDEFGRDILSRVIFGARISLGVGLLSVAIGVLAGGSLGLAGFWGGAVETVATRLADGLLAFPAIILGIAVAAVLGPRAVNAAIAVGIVTVPTFTRLVWSSVLVEKEKEYVQGAECLGASGSAARRPARPPERPAAPPGPGDHRLRPGDPARGVAQLPGPRRPASRRGVRC
ncbi:MAG: ABC transporter permease [Candidatus Rokuibacteriota bacterium]